MKNLTVKDISHGREVDVRVWADVNPMSRSQLGRFDVIEEDKGPISLRAAEGSTRPTEKPSIFRALASIVSSIAGVESLRLQTGSLASIQLMAAGIPLKLERLTAASTVLTVN